MTFGLPYTTPKFGSPERYIQEFGRPPWCWPGDVIRRQRIGDLNAHLRRRRSSSGFE